MTYDAAVRWGTDELKKAGVPEAELSAWYLLQACVREIGQRFERSDFFLKKQEEMSPEAERQYADFVEKRKKRIPLEYITGCTEFMGLPFCINEHVLIPRQDTETLVELIYPLCKGKRVLDLCTGSGCIGLSIAVLGEPVRVVMSDVSPEALCVAERNEKFLREENADSFMAETAFVCGDLFEPVQEVFDVIVSNPPYIETEVIQGLMQEVRVHEPAGALDGGKDGLSFYRRIVDAAPSYLSGAGILCFEIGYNQGESVSALMREKGFTKIKCEKDLAGNDRVVYGRKG